MSQLIQRIQEAYEREETVRGRPVHDVSELPTSFEAITAAWLEGALCRKVPGARVTGHQLGPADNGSSNRRRIRVDYNEAGRAAGLPERLFCKASHGLANRITLGVVGAAASEANFYNHVRPLLQIEAPVSHFARCDEQSFNSLLMLVDLAGDDIEFCSHRTVMTRARVESQMGLLAELHGKGYSNPEIRAQIERFSTWPQFFERSLEFGMREGSEAGFLAGEEVIPPRLYRRHAEIWPATLASFAVHKVEPLTLAHGDVHLKNWFGVGKSTMGLSDWQCLGRGHWSRDIAYTIGTALTPEDRRAWEQDLLRFYLDRLHAAGGPAVGFDEAWRHYRQQMVTALTWWTITLNPAPGMPDMQPRDITLEFVRRLSTAMDDIGTLDSYG